MLRSRLQEKFNLLDIDELNTLNSIADDKTKQTCNTFIQNWRDNGLLYGYFGTKCNEIERRRRVRYNDILELYIYWCFIMYELEINPEEQRVFRHLANYYYEEGQREVGKEPKEIPERLYIDLINTPCVNGYTLDQYKGAIALQNTYQIHRQAVSQIQRGQKPNVNEMNREIEREENERLKTGLKISGVIDMILIGINNRAKVEGIQAALPKEVDGQVRFIAVMDERTTKMCKSLDGQLFNIKGQNTFRRYSDKAKGIMTFSCKGLVEGLNLPPINDNFHWCRSTIIYNVDKPKNEWYDKYVEMKTRNNEGA